MRRHLSIALFFAAALVGACIPSNVAPPVSSSPGAGVSASQAPQRSASPNASLAPASEEPPASLAPAQTATPSPAGSAASPSAGTGAAAACSGTDNNRTFFEDAAVAVSWTVYCAVLPAGWFVDSGQYRGSGGGKVEISYKGPGGARLELHEGAFCSAADGCVLAGTDAGDASFDGSTGTLVTLDGGGWAVVVDRGKAISWLAVGTGLSQSAFQKIAGDLATVGG